MSREYIKIKNANLRFRVISLLKLNFRQKLSSFEKKEKEQSHKIFNSNTSYNYYFNNNFNNNYLVAFKISLALRRSLLHLEFKILFNQRSISTQLNINFC